MCKKRCQTHPSSYWWFRELSTGLHFCNGQIIPERWNSIRIIYFLSWEGFIRPKTDMVICFKSLRLATRCTYRLLKNSRGTLQHQFHNFVSQISSSRNNNVYNLNSHLFLTLFSWQFQPLQPLVIKALAAISSRIYMVIC